MVTTPLVINREICWFFRVPLLDGLAKAGIGRNIDKYLEKCSEYGVPTDDLYYKEDQPGDAWYLIGDWKPVGLGYIDR